MCEQTLWKETRHLMTFVKAGVVPRIYEYIDNNGTRHRYPAWEMAGNPHNVWLISKEKLDENVKHKGSYPDKIAEGNGYYIYGFTYDRKKPGQARGEFFRYLANRQRTDREWKVFIPEFAEAAQTNILIQNEPPKSSPRKSAAPAQSAGKDEKKAEKQEKKKEDTPSLEECKTIILENFENFQKAYNDRYKKEFLGSDDVKWFFRKEDLEKIKEWNKKASNVDDLIDLCAFYELILGNPSKADVVILGNNPGAKGIFEKISSFEKIFEEMADRKTNKDCFYPMSSVNAIQNRPWFPNRLIYGVGSDKWKKRDEKDGILYPFMQNGDLSSLCQYAATIATVELVPYHTKTFAAGENFLDAFDLFDPSPVIQAMNNNAVIIALFRNTAERWCKKWSEYRKKHPEVKDLKQYRRFYVNHKREGNDRSEANASLSRQSLRRYPEFQASISPKDKRELYPSYDAYSEITDYLEMEKNWKRIKE